MVCDLRWLLLVMVLTGSLSLPVTILVRLWDVRLLNWLLLRLLVHQRSLLKWLLLLVILMCIIVVLPVLMAHAAHLRMLLYIGRVLLLLMGTVLLQRLMLCRSIVLINHLRVLSVVVAVRVTTARDVLTIVLGLIRSATLHRAPSTRHLMCPDGVHGEGVLQFPLIPNVGRILVVGRHLGWQWWLVGIPRRLLDHYLVGTGSLSLRELVIGIRDLLLR